MSREHIILGGFGGQGIILAGFITGQAAAIYDGKNATLTQSYGPEARGGACHAQVVISDDSISYPYIENPSVLVAMSQEAYTKYAAGLDQNTLLFIDKDLVKPQRSNKNRIFAIPATTIARELGRSGMANIVMLGFVTAVAKVVSKEAMKKSLTDSVPKGTEELNLSAFERGYTLGMNSRRAKKAGSHART